MIISTAPDIEAEIAHWCNENELTTVQKLGGIVNPNTFRAEVRWKVEDEQEQVLFKLKWSNT